MQIVIIVVACYWGRSPKTLQSIHLTKFSFDKLLCKFLQREEGLHLSEKTINYGDLSIQAVLSEMTIELGIQSYDWSQ